MERHRCGHRAGAVRLALPGRRRFGVALFCAICLVLLLAAGLASLVRYWPASTRSARRGRDHRALAAAGVIAIPLFLAGCYAFTVARIGDNLALV